MKSISLASSDLLRLVHAYELHEVSVQAIGRFALVMQMIVDVLSV